ncbi:hypothetical protein FGB62_111g00 [Gracilaria domingensis]|nr:hypothetical protein FGB62_111g00 [Gracilaria domingensis]
MKKSRLITWCMKGFNDYSRIETKFVLPSIPRVLFSVKELAHHGNDAKAICDVQKEILERSMETVANEPLDSFQNFQVTLHIYKPWMIARNAVQEIHKNSFTSDGFLEDLRPPLQDESSAKQFDKVDDYLANVENAECNKISESESR